MNALKIYGEGDNSVTDRMWYELALQICNGLQGLKTDQDKVTIIAVCIGASTVSPTGTVTNEHVIPFVEPSRKILDRLNSLGTSYISRISVEYVRQQLEIILKSS